MLNAVKIVINENRQHWRTMLRLASFESKMQYSGTFLGFIWAFLNPALQIFIFWLVFSVGIRGGAPINGFPYLIWLMCGLIPWFFINALLSGTAYAFTQHKGIIVNMALPLSILPVKSIFSQLLHHSYTMIVLIALFLLYGIKFQLTWVFVIYYAFATIAFFIGYALITSAINTIYPDFNGLLSSIIRLLFFVTPLMWTFENFSHRTAQILRLNPMVYIIEGYRNSLLYGNTPMAHWRLGIYFWLVSLILFVIGCGIHCKLRKQFVDLM